MASGAWAETLYGDCVNNLKGCMPFKTVTIHTLMGPSFGPQPFYNGAGFCSCGKVSPSDDAETGFASGRYNNLDYTSFTQGPRYGRQPMISDSPARPVGLKHQNGSTLYFKTADVDNLNSRLRFILNQPNYVSGPAIKRVHMVTPLKRRLKGNVNLNNKNYQNRYKFNFTDASVTSADSSANGGPIYGQTDWLGHIHPAAYFWTNSLLDEPFKAVDFYEQSGQSPNVSDDNRMWYMPFCSSIPAYGSTSSNSPVGSYIGYTVIYYLSFGFVHFGDASVTVINPETGQPSNKRPFLPCDYRKEVPAVGDCDKISHGYQLLSLDAHWFMVGTNGIGSPKVGSIRGWFYNDPNQDVTLCNPYMYSMFLTPADLSASIWRLYVNFNMQDLTQRQVTFGLTGLGMYLSP